VSRVLFGIESILDSFRKEIEMVTKRKLGRGKVRVTFTMPKLEGVKQLFLVGDFNNWSVAETPMTRAADETWSAAVTLESGHRYQYRYFADNQVWHNDWAADAYVTNSFGSENSVVDLEEAPPAPPKPKKKSPAAKKPAKA
jgi:1,4-alpha-glucan branching enzyme